MSNDRSARTGTMIAYIVLSIITALLLSANSINAAISGECSTCHTMHNSQNAAVQATLGASGEPWEGTGPFGALVKGDCLGCHGSGNVDANGVDPVTGAPQVYHNGAGGAPDLAGGNFGYITGARGSFVVPNNDVKGHNVVDLGNLDDTLDGPPGFILVTQHDSVVAYDELTCAGKNGCHGKRLPSPAAGSGMNGLRGAHHANVDGEINDPTADYNSYRFLWGVKGYENSNWRNVSAASHNEYFGDTSPPQLQISGSCYNTGGCHQTVGSDTIIVAPDNTMSGFCATCHGEFHTLGGLSGALGTSTGIGDDATAPFVRHPTDVVLPATGEYSNYSSYNVNAPIARPTVYTSPDANVNPGTDIVMCLSCHAAHATDYPDMLRFDYTTMIANGGANSTGCFTCHTTKDDGS